MNAGGDIATRGGVWTVAVETPDGSLTLELSGSSALATSGSDSRRWRRGGRELHHIIDPATGEPSASDLLRVTVVAGDAADAEVTAKALFLAGSEAARREADELAIPAVLVTAAGRDDPRGRARMKTDPTFWLLARASGLTAYILLTLSVLAGLILKSRPFGRAVKASSVMDLHRVLSLLGLDGSGRPRHFARARQDGEDAASPACSSPARPRTGRSRSRSASSRRS